MQVQVHTDRHIRGNEALTAQVRDTAESALARFGDRITRVEIHLSDQNADRSGPNDKRCVMEARLKGRQPLAVTHEAATLDLAIDGASARLARAIDSMLDRIVDPRNHVPDARSPDER